MGGNGNGNGNGNGPSGDAFYEGDRIARGVHRGANPPPLSDQIWKEVKDFVRAQGEGIKDSVEAVEDVVKDMKHEVAKEIADDFREDPTDRYKDD